MRETFYKKVLSNNYAACKRNGPEKLLRLPVRCLQIDNLESSRSEMELIGVDPAGAEIMAPKQFHYNIKAEGLTPAQANIIKQDMLSIGGEAAVARGVVSCTVDTTGAIISGTLKQISTLIEKLRYQSLGLAQLAEDISLALEGARATRWQIKGREKSWSVGKKTLLMGILNITPDSFSDGGRFLDAERAVERGLEMTDEGADWIDVGGESTRPGAEPVGEAEELKRVLPVVEALSKRGLTVSVDTMKSKVARRCLEAGASIINDVSALSDKEMAKVCAEFGCPVILMHMRGTPKTMQLDVRYKDLMSEVYYHLLERMEYAVSEGIDRQSIVIDPGLGFGKPLEGNMEIIRRLAEFKSLGRPILLGASRKSFIGKTLGEGVEKRLIGTTAISAIAVMNGVAILRVHDVKEAKAAIDMADAVRPIKGRDA